MSPELKLFTWRIRPRVRVNNDLFPQDPPSYIYCTVIVRTLGSDEITNTWHYRLKKVTGGQPGTHTTYRPVRYYWDQEDWLGKYPDNGYSSVVPILLTNQEPPISCVYNVVISASPILPPYIPQHPTIAWAKTVNFIADPEAWWGYNPFNYRFELNMEPPPYYVTVFNNFPHPCGSRQGHPPYWPNPNDTCHVDWLKRSLWPQYLDEAVCSNMLLEMLIDDWGTWEELFDEHILTIPRWVQ